MRLPAMMEDIESGMIGLKKNSKGLNNVNEDNE